MYNHVLYLSYWFVNSLMLYLFFIIFPENVVLGNFKFSPLEAAIYAGFWATVLIWTLWDYVYVRDVKLNVVSGRFVIFWAFNFVSFWLVSRFAHLTGFGISHYWWALFVGLAAHLLQRLMWIIVVGRNLGSSGGLALD